MIELFKKLFKKKIKYHEVSKLLKSQDLFFDVGAHMGDKSKELIKNNINVIMFEPQPECLKELNKLYLNNPLVKIVPKALGKFIGKMDLNINTKEPTVSTLAKHWQLGRFSHFKWDQKITIEITTLDEMIKKFGSPNYIKIDVEGFEYDVLLGLSKKAGIISFEFTSEFINDAYKCIDHLISLNYSQFNFSLGERQKFYSKWTNHKNIINEIKENIKKDNFLWGDIYCK